MKRVEAIISPFKLDDVKSALSELGVTGLTATEVRGCGRQIGYRATNRDAEYKPELTPKVKVEAVVADHLVARTIEVIERVSRTGRIGDGKIFVSPVDEAVRIRTGERAEEAI